MAERALAIERLSTVSSDQIFHCLRDETVFEIVASLFPSPPPESELELLVESPKAFLLPETTKPRKQTRPLNAFMAFRSYYVKLFPEVQQKTASGFLTKLWHQDTSGNKWSLVARLYSHVRDTLGRSRVSLSEFLSLACPKMCIIPPSMYLAKSGWAVEDGESGSKTLIRATVNPPDDDTHLTAVPGTEMELLVLLVQDGYMPDNGLQLLEELNASYRGLMTAPADSGERNAAKECTTHKFRAISTSSTNPPNIFTPANEVGVQSYPYDFPSAASSFSCENILSLERVPEQQPFNIDSPWDVDRVFQCTTEPSQLESPASSPYDPREDFHYHF